jgi:hypothetical protein
LQSEIERLSKGSSGAAAEMFRLMRRSGGQRVI